MGYKKVDTAVQLQILIEVINMTKKQKVIVEQYIEELMELKGSDNELAHSMADSLVLSALRDLGFGELADAFHELEDNVGGFWYA